MSEETAVSTEVVDAEVLGFEDDISALSAPERVAVETAKAHPRSIERFRKDLAMLASMDEESAQSMFYSLKRGKTIQGPSIRFAECAMHAYGNIRVYARIVDVGATQLIAEGAGWDLERNVQQSKRVTRRITYANGSRYNQDMIAVTENAAISIATRNVVLSLIPRPLYKDAYELAVRTAAGDEKTIKTRRKELVSWWKEQGGTVEQLWDWLEIKGQDDMDAFAITRMVGLKTAIAEGMTTFQRELDLMSGVEIGEDEAASLDAELLGED